MSCEHCPPGLFAGILWPAWPDDRSAPEGWSFVEHCRHCGRYADDEAAAAALIDLGFGTTTQWFDRHTHQPRERSSRDSLSLAIDFPEHWRSTQGAAVR